MPTTSLHHRAVFVLPVCVLSLAYRRLLRPILFRFDAERVHHFAMAFLHGNGPAMQTLRRSFPQDASTAREVFGLKFPNPVGLAAGFDKNALVLPAWEGLGFGFAEVGTITAKAQPGNPQPRLFRVPELSGVINRMGFNNDGADAVAKRLEKLRATSRWPQFPVGINLGKSKVTPLEEAPSDYLYSFERLREVGDYFVLNVSSPNTPGLRKLQDRAALAELFSVVQRANTGRKPLLVKSRRISLGRRSTMFWHWSPSTRLPASSRRIRLSTTAPCPRTGYRQEA